MFCKQERPILALISENNSLTNQHLDSLSKDKIDLKESSKFSQNYSNGTFKNMGNKV